MGSAIVETIRRKDRPARNGNIDRNRRNSQRCRLKVDLKLRIDSDSACALECSYVKWEQYSVKFPGDDITSFKTQVCSSPGPCIQETV